MTDELEAVLNPTRDHPSTLKDPRDFLVLVGPSKHLKDLFNETEDTLNLS